MIVWKASRGFGGKSYAAAALGLAEATTLGVDISILGGSGEQSRRVHAYQDQFWRHPEAPRALLRSDPAAMATRLAYGNTITALMASQASVRGPHPPRLRLDEADEVDLSIFDAAMGQTMAKPTPFAPPGAEAPAEIPAQTVISSTWHHADGTMTEVLRRAAEKHWPVFSWCYRETIQPHGWLAPAEVARKRGEVSQTMFEVEYDLQEPNPQSRAIQPEAVTRMFRHELGTWEGEEGEYIELEPPAQDGAYVTGCDWAKAVNWTVIVTFLVDRRPARLVAFERLGRRPWPDMVARLDARVRRYPGAACYDETGLGTVIADLLQCEADGVTLVGRDRSGLLTAYVAAIEGGELEAPVIRFMESEHRLAAVSDLYGAGHLPDSICAGALAWEAFLRHPPLLIL